MSSLQTSPASSQELDPERLYPTFLFNQRWREQLARRAAHKSLDLADDDMQINTRSGIGALGMVGVAAAAGLPAAAIAAMLLLQQWHGAPQTPSTGPADSDYEVRFFDKDGKLIEVPPIRQRP